MGPKWREPLMMQWGAAGYALQVGGGFFLLVQRQFWCETLFDRMDPKKSKNKIK